MTFSIESVYGTHTAMTSDDLDAVMAYFGHLNDLRVPMFKVVFTESGVDIPSYPEWADPSSKFKRKELLAEFADGREDYAHSAGAKVFDTADRTDGYKCCSGCRGRITVLLDGETAKWVHL